MSDTVEDFKALDEFHRQEREKAWAERELAFERIRHAGPFIVKVISAESRHVRIIYPGAWVDFWPSTARWIANGVARRNKASGRDLDSLLTFLGGLGL